MSKGDFPPDLQTRALQLTKTVPDSINLNRVKQKIEIAADKTLTEKERYEALYAISFFMGIAYTDSNNPEFRKYTADLGEYARKASPSLYKKNEFNLLCQDSTCAPPVPNEIKIIISKIDSSKLSTRDKEAIVGSLKSISYLEEKSKTEKASLYIGVAEDLKKIAKVSTSSAILNISNELDDFVKKKYPQDFEEIQKARNEYIKKYGEQLQ